MEEQWKPIKLPLVDEVCYAISNMGTVINMHTNEHVKQFPSNRGYPMVHLKANGKTYLKTVHRLVAEAFVPGKSEENNIVNHLNGVKNDNRSVNLEWTTQSNNIKHAYSMGLISIDKITGVNNSHSTIDEDSVERICLLLLDTEGDCRQVFAMMSDMGKPVSFQIIQQIKYKRSWVVISDKFFDEYRFPKYKLTESEVEYICEILESFSGDLRKTYDIVKDSVPLITYQNLYQIKKRATHAKISNKYNW